MRILLILLLAITAPALASDPGQPLNCSDCVFHEPGLSCTVISSVGELGTGWNAQEPFLRNGSNAIVDNTGATYTVRTVNIAGAPQPNDVVILGIVQLLRFANGEWELSRVLPTETGA